MKVTLKNYQEEASRSVLKQLCDSMYDFRTRGDLSSVTLSAPTGAGKTVIAAAVIEALLDGGEGMSPDGTDSSADENAVVLWVTDDPPLNAQTRNRISSSSSSVDKGRLVMIGGESENARTNFDQPELEVGKVYFLNTQKLMESGGLGSPSNRRDSTFWQTLERTIKNTEKNLYVIIDEAHRGMASSEATIVQRIINGSDKGNGPAPVVWGISATLEKYETTVANTVANTGGARIIRTSNTVDAELVRKSGLIKDLVVLDNPDNHTAGAETGMLRSAIRQLRETEAAWNDYSDKQHVVRVEPILVLQVGNRPSDVEMSNYIDAIFLEWPDLDPNQIVNTFGEHSEIAVGGTLVRYARPQDIQFDRSIRIVLCKDAITTGWDCPRAEVLVSLRRAKDDTYVAQLIGRMVRTPLARSIKGNKSLNNVYCYLPNFDRETVHGVLDRLRGVPSRVIQNPISVKANRNLPPEVFEIIGDLPTETVPSPVYVSPIKRLRSLAAQLNSDQILSGANAAADSILVRALDGLYDQHTSTGDLIKMVEVVRRSRISRIKYDPISGKVDPEESTEGDHPVDLDGEGIRALFREAQKMLPHGTASLFWRHLCRTTKATDSDSRTELQLEVAALSIMEGVSKAVESAADEQVEAWLGSFKMKIEKISAVDEAKGDVYREIVEESLVPELSSIDVDETGTVEMSSLLWDKHILSTDHGKYPMDANGWEREVLNLEIADPGTIAWMRNPTYGSGSLCIAYLDGEKWRGLHPDFIFVTRNEAGAMAASIVDPHGVHLPDALAKLKGLSRFTQDYGDKFDRIHSIGVGRDDSTFRYLDHKDSAVVHALRWGSFKDAREIFEALGKPYTGPNRKSLAAAAA